MAAAYAYALSPKKVPNLFDRIRKLGVPKEGIDKWLPQAGFASATDKRIKSVLRQVGFIDDKGNPTGLWQAYRGPDSAAKLADGIRAGYADLFAMYPDAHIASDEELSAFITANTPLSGTTVNLAVSTFRQLVQLADFGEDGSEAIDKGKASTGAQAPTNLDGQRDESDPPSPRAPTSAVVINVSLELTLPESRDPAVYDALFAALSKHIIQNNA